MVEVQGATGVARLTQAELAQRLLAAERDVNLALDTRPETEADAAARDDYLNQAWAEIERLRTLVRRGEMASNPHYDRQAS